MRICHLSDSHLGAGKTFDKRAPGGLTLRQEDIIKSFCEAIEKIAQIKPDLCFHSGDLFEDVRPLNRVMAIAGEQLHKLATVNKIPVVIIAGNHDAPKQPYQGAAIEVFSHIENLFVAAGSRLEVFDINGCNIFALPHCLTTDILHKQIQELKPDNRARFNFLLMHGVAEGMPEFSMADLGEQEISTKAFDGFDYVALGHYHNFCKVRDRAYYAGSTERTSLAERGIDKGFIVVDLEPFRVSFQQVSARPMVDVSPIDASGLRGDEIVERLQQSLSSVGTADKIVRTRVTGVTPEAMKTLSTDLISKLKEESFDLRVQFERVQTEDSKHSIGKTAIGRIDHGFLNYLDDCELSDSDRKRLKQDALKYLHEED